MSTRIAFSPKEIEMPIINLYANIRTIVGKKTVNLPGMRVGDVLQRLVQEYPDVRRYVLDGENLRPRLVVTLNGKILNPEGCLQTAVSDQDEIGIFPPVAGG